MDAERDNSMDKQKQIALVSETDEDRYSFSRIYDRLTGAEQKNIPGFTAFLSPREQALTRKMLPLTELHFLGGHADAERCVCAWLPDYMDILCLTEEDLPFSAVRATYYEKDALSHRVFLGALMGAGIKRETVGDIYVQKGSCDFLVLQEILPYVLDNLTSAGRTVLHLEKISLSQLSVPAKSVREIRDTVSSLRLDSLVGTAFGLTRGKASDLIAAGKVSVNDLPCLKNDKQLSEGDRITVRGLGRAVLTLVGGKTKKDRISIVMEKYV